MKRLGILLVLSLFFTSCFKDTDDEIFLESPVIGNWKHFESIDDIITEEEEETGNQWERVENGRTMVLRSDGTFSRLTSSCSSGSYILNSETIVYNCDATDSDEPSIRYSFEDEFLILSFGFIAEKFRRIAAEED